MRKILVSLFISCLIGLCAVAEEPVPSMRPASPDVPSEVKSDDGNYLPNVIKQNTEQPQVKKEEPSIEDMIEDDEDEDSSEDETEETDDETQDVTPQETEQSKTQQTEQTKTQQVEPKPQQEPDTPLDEVLEGDKNPINNDSTQENIKNKNFVPEPMSAEDKQKAKQKVKKVKKGKKQKPKYGKYNDVNEDLYIQNWEEELKNEAQKNQLNNDGTTESTDESSATEQEEARAKTYTQDDYEQAYRDMQVPTFTFVHGVDPDQYYDMKDTIWSPYPLLRLNSPLYFKTVTIEPGYYLLTPRKYKDDWYILFKEAGAVKYTIPVFDRSFVSATYYRDNLKELDMTKSARWQIKFLNAWGKYVRKSKRRPATQCNVELTDLDNNFLLIELYYGAHKYSTIFRIEKF